MRRFSPTRGFTLIELLAVISIMAIITSILLIRQQQFDSSTLLRSLSYSVALSVRQAQVYGVSIEEYSTSGGSGQYAPAYGLYFSSADPSHYYLFADVNGNGQPPTPNQDIQAFTLSPGYTISGFCASQGSTCVGGSSGTYLIVEFHRPNPDACFATSAEPGVCAAGETPIYSSAYIQLASQNGSTRSVTISSTGEIAVGNPGS